MRERQEERKRGTRADAAAAVKKKKRMARAPAINDPAPRLARGELIHEVNSHPSLPPREQITPPQRWRPHSFRFLHAEQFVVGRAGLRKRITQLAMGDGYINLSYIFMDKHVYLLTLQKKLT